MIFTKTRKEFVQFRLQNTKNIWRENLFAQRNFGAKVHKSNIRVKRWHNKYEIINSIERQNFCLNYLLFKSNRTALQTHKVEERIFCMEQDVKKICSEANYHLRNISKIRKYLTQDCAPILIHAFISSKLDYCNSLLYGIPKYLVCRLQRVQNTAARIVTLTRKYDSITPIMFKLHWLPVHSRIIFKLLLLVYKALNGKAPSYISSLLSHRKCSRSLRSSGQELLTVPLAKLKTYGDRAFSIAAPRQWNNLPLSIRKSPSIAIFKRHLKTYLFKEAYGF